MFTFGRSPFPDAKLQFMLLSVIVPFYNAENYVSRCLECLLNQDLAKTEYEILIMDDGSSDGSLSIVQDYADKNNNIRLFRQENNGACSARNALMEEVRGEYIYFMDADDLIAFNVLGRLVKEAKRLSLDVLTFDTEVTSNIKDFEQDVTFTFPTNPNVLKGYQYLDENPGLRLEVWWYLIRVSFIKEQGFNFDQNELSGDILFTLNIFTSAERVLHLAVPLHCYFQSELSIMRNKDLRHRRVLIEDIHLMIQDFSNFITQLQHKKIRNKASLVQNLEKRKIVFVIFFLAKLVRSDINSKKARIYLQELRKIGAYPINSSHMKEFSPLKKAMVNILFNREHFLLPTIDLTTLQYNLRNSA